MKQFILLIIVLVSMLSCQKTIKENGSSASNVYVAGSELIGSNLCAVYWKNGVQTQLSSNTGEVNDIYVVGNDVYAVGYEGGTVRYPMLWKNGVKTQLSSSPGVATTVVVSGSDVYVSGTEDVSPNLSINTAFFWKNGTKTQIGPYTTASSMFINGSDVHVAGVSMSEVAAYWLNGVKVSNLPASYGSRATAIFVSGSEFYMIGADGPPGHIAPVLWRNTMGGVSNLFTVTPLSSNTASSASSIYVANNNTYISGYDGGACYWKNGVLSQLSTNTSSNTNKVFISGSDVYISGNDSVAVYWKNGTKVKVSANLSSRSNSIFIL